MDIMLDTHIIMWHAKSDKRLSKELFSIIEDGSLPIYVSEVSLLEVAIKRAKNPAAMPYTANDFVQLCEVNNFILRPITREAILAYGMLNFDAAGDLHKDPFDRLLIAHAKSEGLQLATQDRLLALYGEPCISVYV